MSKENIKLKKGTEEVIIRKGDAAKIREEKIVNLSGVIGAPAEFWGKRKKKHPLVEAHIEYSRDSRMITLVTDEKDHFGGSVIGKIEDNPDLVNYHINGTSTFGVKELLKFLRMRRSHFAERDEHVKLISNLSKFKVKVATEIENSGNDRGDVTKIMEQKVQSDLPLDFKLNIRVFKGMEKREFTVDILFNVQDNQTSLWFESPELAEIQDKMVDAAIDNELKVFKELVVIEQ